MIDRHGEEEGGATRASTSASTSTRAQTRAAIQIVAHPHARGETHISRRHWPRRGKGQVRHADIVRGARQRTRVNQTPAVKGLVPRAPIQRIGEYEAQRRLTVTQWSDGRRAVKKSNQAQSKKAGWLRTEGRCFRQFSCKLIEKYCSDTRPGGCG